MLQLNAPLGQTAFQGGKNGIALTGVMEVGGGALCTLAGSFWCPFKEPLVSELVQVFQPGDAFRDVVAGILERECKLLGNLLHSRLCPRCDLSRIFQYGPISA